MSRRPAVTTQPDVARAIRAAKQAGAEAEEVRPGGTIIVLLKNPPTVPDENPPEPAKRVIHVPPTTAAPAQRDKPPRRHHLVRAPVAWKTDPHPGDL
jgi:hypothetical protein